VKLHLKICFIFYLIVFPFSAKASLSNEEQLTGLCKVWGFLKYYHPAIQTGKIDWNNYLINILPDFSQKLSREEYNIRIKKIIDFVGGIKKLKYPYQNLPKDTTYNNLDFKWIEDNSLFDQQNQKSLFYVIENYVPRKSFYIKNEIAKYYDYKDLESFYFNDSIVPDSTHAILALFQYWNTINYLFAYRKIMDENWDSVLIEFLPKVIESSSSFSFYNVMAELATKINDCHGFYENYYFNYNVGFMKSANDGRPSRIKVEYVEGNTVVVEAAPQIKNEGLKIGDIITEINGYPIDEIRKELKKYCGCSHEHSVNREIDFGIFISWYVPKDEYISMKVKGSDEVVRTITYFNKPEKDGSSDETKFTPKLNIDSIGYIDLSWLSMKEIGNAIDKNRDTKAIIFDLRDNAAGALFPIGLRLIKKQKKNVVFSNYYEGNLKFPGTFKFDPVRSGYLGLRIFHKKYQGKVIFLINENVQSTYEFQLMAFRAAFDVTFIGSNTAGADGVATSVFIEPNILTYFTMDAVFYPDGRPTQRIGIVPDIYVTPTVEGIRNLNDEVLDRAIEYVNSITKN